MRAEFSDNNGGDGAAELTGARAMAWLENNLLGPCRVPWISIQRAKEAQKELHAFWEKYKTKKERALQGGTEKRLDRLTARLYNKPGEIASCLFTGMCYDNDVIAEIQKAVGSGDTLEEAFEGLADYYRRTLEAEIESRQMPEAFIEDADANERLFTKDGELYRG